jgi:hypothetical protein
VRVRTIEIPQKFLHGDYEGDKDFRVAIHKWVQQLWQEKDQQIESLLKKAGAVE